ncbi:MAG: BamA/TamA family outer membrane protein [Bacteroidetes bacterium]|jgi:hypothetical protein|nr:BamA/TamA family outer membrane protein [Bacteroidota bacterium]MBT3749839.1 BamA/TamA family outer membrane protein [Bacteroidota bacterium]MBT4410113.1 BamA/TamA family outer membrane protein [Bacteroidota bacterium]MBT7095635.1 BamA/TamA family outer membrane protein [Bacteroidota bacterium]MBT7466430.1 BamA/TamA family outer membrane protein [Bacteroidota bacterium]
MISQFQSALTQTKTPIEDAVYQSNAQQLSSYSILFTGNTAKGTLDEELFEEWNEASQDSDDLAYLMLGNIYDPEKRDVSKKLLQNGKYPMLLSPGEKEWANGSSLGKKMIKDIEEELEKEYQGPVYRPDAACPGPKEIVLSDHLVVILIDTHWWVHKFDRRYNKCGIETSADILILIEDAIRRHHTTKHVLIAGHHSLKSYGNSGGYFSLKQSIFEAPYTLFRKLPGTRKDSHHPDFKGFRDAMLSILKKYPDLIYASAGDANLQYFADNEAHHIVSGAFSQSEFVREDLAEFASSEKGFARLNFSSDGDCNLIFTSTKGEIFRKTIYKKSFISDVMHEDVAVYQADSIVINASSRYNMKESAYFWMGENYRDIWDTPVKVPVFDLGSKKGGLQILKRGGGQQTLSLRLQDKAGKQYVLRSLEKNVEGVLPGEFRNTLVLDVVQDQISASNPYAGLVVAKLAEDAGVFHANPELVYIPDDPRFGIYRSDLAGRLYLFEERPANDRSDVAGFGFSEDIISTDEMIEKIFDDEDHFVDPDATLRARLFDILINDWDRHDDQWRWAGFKMGEKTIYKPIPRDRDQAFFVNEGVLPWIAKRKTLIPKIQGFDDFTENMEGQAFNARYFDRTFLIHSKWNDWLEQIDILKSLLTHERIDEAVLNFPEEVQALCADQTAEILKVRLENLEPMARELYLSLAKEISITGTNEEDLFEIIIPNDTTIRVKGFHRKKDNKKGAKIYHREFYSSETKKIRIYGFDKKDHFHIEGNEKNKIDLIIIGGASDDNVTYDGTRKPGFLTIYDKKSTDLSSRLENSIISIYNDDELKYDREAYKYNIVFPGLFTGYNQDDGIFLGGGANYRKFSRYNYQEYEVLASYALLTNAFKIHVANKYVYPLKRFQIGIIADYKSPSYTNNYFGMGNETQWQRAKSEREYYNIRMSEKFLRTDLIKLIGKDGDHQAGLSFFYKNTHVEATPDRYVSDFSKNDLDHVDLQENSFAGFSLNYKLSTIPQANKKEESDFGGGNMFPTRGTLLKTEVSHFQGLNSNSTNFTRISGEWTSYLSFSQRPRIVYVARLGGEKLFGDYAFHEAATLGQKSNLRGFRLTRFYGDASFYLNTEVRIRVKEFKTYILNGTAGLLLFNDVGRVWLNGENSKVWHDGYGLGLWWSPFDMTIFSVSYARSTEDSLINFSLKYQF